jgi:hypothetical protein
MSDEQWDVREFIQRLRKGELDGQLEDTADVLKPEQIQDLHRLLHEAERPI